MVDPTGTILANQFIEVARIEDIEERFSAFVDLSAQDFQRTLKATMQRSRATSAVALNDLELPSPTALFAFLRLADPNDIAPEQLAVEARIGLRRDLDLDEIAYRLAGLPIHLPPDFVREWGQKLLEIEVEARIGPKESPLLALLRLRALASAGAQQIDLTSGVQALADALRNRGELMVAIVRYAASQALHRTDWRNLTPAARVTLLWVYADQMTQILATPGVDLREVAEWVESKTRLDLTDHETQSESPEWVTFLTAHLSLERLSGAIVASLIREGLLARLPVWDAIGAIARGNQVVVVGDPEQLPPTSVGQRSGDGDDEDDTGVVKSQQSILDECLASNLPNRQLSWHYRSRHESLIAFSNAKYYRGELVTFPSPVTQDTAVRYIHVEGGVYPRR